MTDLQEADDSSRGGEDSLSEPVPSLVVGTTGDTGSSGKGRFVLPRALPASSSPCWELGQATDAALTVPVLVCGREFGLPIEPYNTGLIVAREVQRV